MTVIMRQISCLLALWPLAAFLVLSGCGDLPRPFARDHLAAAANPLVSLRSGTGVTVEPAVGLPVPWNRLVALEIAEMLRDQGIPAEAGEAGGLGHRLSLRVAPVGGSATPGTLPLETTWRLDADDGTALAGNVDRAEVEALAWERAAPEGARELGAPVVAAVSAALGGGGWSPGPLGATAAPPAPRAAPTGAVTQATLDAPPLAATNSNTALAQVPEGRKAPPPPDADQRPPAPPPPSAQAKAVSPDGKVVMALAPRITEAPGTGARELEQAMATLIRAAGMAVTREPEKAAFAIIGSVTTTPLAGDKEKVELVWRVVDPKTDAELGTVRQQNFIPKGMLDGAWGRLAYEIAQAALEGVGEVLTNPTR